MIALVLPFSPPFVPIIMPHQRQISLPRDMIKFRLRCQMASVDPSYDSRPPYLSRSLRMTASRLHFLCLVIDCEQEANYGKDGWQMDNKSMDLFFEINICCGLLLMVVNVLFIYIFIYLNVCAFCPLIFSWRSKGIHACITYFSKPFKILNYNGFLRKMCA